MVQHRRFGDLALDDDGLHTPDGTLALAELTRAEAIRNRSRDHAQPTTETSMGAVAGGALLGGAIAGPVAAVGGGLLGSTVKRPGDDVVIPRTVSATLIFETPALAYSTTVPKAQVDEAEAFVAAVKTAAGITT